jgi:hypothetical protein
VAIDAPPLLQIWRGHKEPGTDDDARQSADSSAES